jgi:hypothetical protein
MGRIIKILNAVAGREEKPKAERPRNGHKGNGKRPIEAVQDARTVVVQNSTDPALIQAVQQLQMGQKALIEKQNERDIIGAEGKVILANAVIKPIAGTELRMTRISRRTATLMAADITESALFTPDDEWPTDINGRKMDPAEVWRNAMMNLSVSIQGHQFDKISNLAGMQGGDENEPTDHKYVGR